MMKGNQDGAGVSLREVLVRAIEMMTVVPELTALQSEDLPDYDLWDESRDMINRFDQTWQETQSSGVLAEHPLRLLNPHLANIDRPLKRITEALEPCAELFERVRERLQESHLPGQYWDLSLIHI